MGYRRVTNDEFVCYCSARKKNTGIGESCDAPVTGTYDFTLDCCVQCRNARPIITPAPMPPHHLSGIKAAILQLNETVSPKELSFAIGLNGALQDHILA